jgi:hypothetical protein
VFSGNSGSFHSYLLEIFQKMNTMGNRSCGSAVLQRDTSAAVLQCCCAAVNKWCCGSVVLQLLRLRVRDNRVSPKKALSVFELPFTVF